MSKINKGKANKCLKAMLDGKVITRKTLGDMDIGVNNDSLHALISLLRNERCIPIESFENNDRTYSYFMRQEEIDRFKSINLRKIQREEVKKEVEIKRQKKVVQQYMNFIKALNEHPTLLSKWPDLLDALEDIRNATNELLHKPN